MTNGDKIRQMSNEELAVFMSNVECDIQKFFEDEGRIMLFANCHHMWITWLDSEVEND